VSYGNSLTEIGETCVDGNVGAGDGCSNTRST
jgi:cysteine-rich repeat protein